MIYLDYNATTPVDKRVVETMIDVYLRHVGNAGSRTHLHGDDCRRIVEDSRRNLAELLGVDSSEVFFTSGATESDNLALLGLMEYGEKNGLNHVLVSAVEHKAVLNAAEAMAGSGFEIERIPVNENGEIDVEDTLSRIRPNTLVVSVMHANNETGVIQPVAELGRLLAERCPGVLFHIDAAQSLGKLVNEVRSLTYDLLSGTAHKMYGPQGIGVLVAKRRGYEPPPIKPLMYGGGQEKGVSPGTQPVSLIAGFGKAAILCYDEWESDFKHAERIKELFIAALKEHDLRFCINGAGGKTMPTCCNVCIDGVSSEALMIAAKRSLSISNGSACTSNSYEPSYVLTAMGLDRQQAESSIRVSWGRMLQEDVAKDAFGVLAFLAKGLQG